MRVPYEEMYNEFVRVLLKYGFDKDKAEISAKLYACLLYTSPSPRDRG